jgi:hypothetical protein
LFKTLLLYRASTSSPLGTRPVALTPTAKPVAIAPPTRADQLRLPDRHGDNGASRESDEDLRWRFRESLLRALGLPSEALEEHEVASEAMEAAAELRRQVGAHPGLRIVLERIERDSKRTLDDATQALKGEFAEDEQARHLVAETRREVDRIVLALMLHPERKLFDDLIGEAEEGDDDDLLKRLHMLRDDIERMNPANGTEWRYIAHKIKQLSGGAPISMQ